MTDGARRSGGLYTPAILNAAVLLAAYPFHADSPLVGEARSRSCGSVIAVSLGLDAQGRIENPGIRPHACAVGQAAASLFAAHATGRSRAEIAEARASIANWLTGQGPQPDWPGLSLLEPARAYPARHPAILLAWDAALAAIPGSSLVSGN